MRKQPGDEIPHDTQMCISEYIKGLEGEMLKSYKYRIYNELSFQRSSGPFSATIEEVLQREDIRQMILEKELLSEDHCRLLFRNTLLNAIRND